MYTVSLSKGNQCPICGQKHIEVRSFFEPGEKEIYYYYNCHNCGMYVAGSDWTYSPQYSMRIEDERELDGYNIPKLNRYLFYHKNRHTIPFIMSKEEFLKYEEKINGAYQLSVEMIENWYPKTFAEKVDKILLYFATRSAYMGSEFRLMAWECVFIYFILHERRGELSEALPVDVLKQIEYINNYLVQEKYIECNSYPMEPITDWTKTYFLTITPKGWARIDELQRVREYNKTVFIAMKFGKETIALRESLKEAISKAGYLPVLIDEVQYNGQIVPEMLYQIRESRFVIAELSHHNNGAYYEAGYALGVGKEVIHICEEEAMGSKLHFDVKQVNTITYKADDLDGLKERLIKRIQATIK